MVCLLKYGNVELFDDDIDDDDHDDELDQHDDVENMDETENYTAEEQTVSMSEDDDDDDASDNHKLQPMDVNTEPVLDTGNNIEQSYNIAQVQQNFNIYIIFSFSLSLFH